MIMMQGKLFRYNYWNLLFHK